MSSSLVATGVQFPDSSIQTTAVLNPAFKNRIINGAMVIDQRNTGASVSVSGNYVGAWCVDRFAGVKNGAGVFSLQQSSSAPSGFTSSMKALVTTADTSIATDDFAFINQVIEGYNTADLGFGAAGASTVTLSFWVKSNLTGTYSAVIVNGTGTRSYVSNYTINVANTWEQKTVTVPGDTTGTWDKTNGSGFIVRFGLTAGSTFQQAAGSWGSGNAMATSSNVNWLGALNNDFYVTGVQLEKGSTATSFDYRPYGTELALCQRYYQGTQQYYAPKVASGYARVAFTFPVMRTAPTVTYTDNGGTANRISTFTSADVRTDNRTPVAVTGGNTGAFFVLPNNTDADIAFTVIASLSSEL